MSKTTAKQTLIESQVAISDILSKLPPDIDKVSFGIAGCC